MDTETRRQIEALQATVVHLEHALAQVQDKLQQLHRDFDHFQDHLRR